MIMYNHPWKKITNKLKCNIKVLKQWNLRKAVIPVKYLLFDQWLQGISAAISQIQKNKKAIM